jgi:hypothetical protein
MGEFWGEVDGLGVGVVIKQNKNYCDCNLFNNFSLISPKKLGRTKPVLLFYFLTINGKM